MKVHQPLRSTLKRLRRVLSQSLEQSLLGPAPVTLISDNCWGGEFCRSLGVAYTTPLAGAFILPGDYLTFLENFAQPDALDLAPSPSSHPYPVGRTPYAAIHFMHARTWDEAAAAFRRRAARINQRRLFFKIDFGRAGYTPADIARWNRLALPNAIALLPPGPRIGFDFTHVHRGWRMKSWCHDGAAMYHLSRRSFDFHRWIRTGELRPPGALRRALHLLLTDGLAPSDMQHRLRTWLGREKPRAPAPLMRSPLVARRAHMHAIR